ncbi:MAG: class I adenylate-forming enzyme family protein [Sulfobacillus sp.]
MATVVEVLERSALNFADRPAIQTAGGGPFLTYGQLWERSQAGAGQLAAAGIRPGDRVALLVGNEIEFPLAFWSVLVVGAVAVPVSARLGATELRFILQHSEATAVVAAEAVRKVASEAAQGLPVTVLTAADLVAAKAEADGWEPPAVLADQVAEILYTSGTTGDPKGVVMSHGACVETAAMAAYQFGFQAQERVLILMPLSHSAPLNLFLLGAVYTGGQVVLASFNPRQPEALLEVVQAERVHYLFCAPVAYLLGLKADPSRYNLSSMKRWIYGGAPMNQDQVRTVRRAYGGEWMSVYGLTESGPNGMALAPSDHDGHEGSLGWHPTVNTAIRLVGEDGRDVPPGEPGEIIMRTPSAMSGYLKNEEATSRTLKDGWVYTGDMAVRDQEGYYWMCDRKKDLILSGGYNVFPGEVEEAISAHPAVAEVAVVGTAHPEWGETVTAVIVLRPDATLTLAELRAFLTGRIASQKQPRRLEAVATLPRNPTGKVLKHVLRSQFLS